MFCATVSWGTRLVSWKTIAMPSRLASFGAEKVDRPAVDAQSALRGRDHARDQLAQSRLSRAVLADKRMDFAGLEVEVGALERGDAAIASW